MERWDTVGDGVIGVDVGATRLRVGFFSRDGHLLARAEARTPSQGGRGSVAKAVAELIESLAVEGGFAAVGVGTIGPLDVYTGRVVGTPNAGVRSFDLKEPLEERFGVPVYVVNDATAAAWGEFKGGAGVGKLNVVYVTLSTGVGVGAVVDGNLLIGKSGNAVEAGHIVINYRGVVCGCGGVGHWEAYAGGSAIPRLARAIALEESWDSETAERAVRGEIGTPEIFRLWRLGDPFAVRVINEVIEATAAGLANVINVFDPEVVAVGGSVALKNRDFLRKVIEVVPKYALLDVPPIVEASFGDDAVLYGAAWVAIDPPPTLLKYYLRAA